MKIKTIQDVRHYKLTVMYCISLDEDEDNPGCAPAGCTLSKSVSPPPLRSGDAYLSLN